MFWFFHWTGGLDDFSQSKVLQTILESIYKIRCAVVKVNHKFNVRENRVLRPKSPKLFLQQLFLVDFSYIFFTQTQKQLQKKLTRVTWQSNHSQARQLLC